MAAIERDNPLLKGVLPKDYGRPGLDKQRLGQIINLVSDIALGSPVVESRTLSALCDALLPKLISGELRVKDADRIASWATA